MLVTFLNLIIFFNLGNVFPSSFVFCPLEFIMGGWGTPAVFRKFSYQSCKALMIWVL